MENINLKIYKCQKCGHEFVIINDFTKCCIHCKSENIKITIDRDNFSLYDNETQTLLDYKK